MVHATHDGGLLLQALRELKRNWEITGAQWNDQARSGFESQYLQELMPDVKRAADSMGQVNRLLRKAIRDCS